jgi:two-component system phosphate regulon response regulator PhoB
MNILLVEPDFVLAQTYKQLLEVHGHNIVTAATAQEAIVEADKQTPDLVVCELQLVSHSGIEFLYELRSYPEWQQIPVIVHTSVPPFEFVSSRQGLAQELGIAQYLYKPATDLSQLIRAVTEAGISYEAV